MEALGIGLLVGLVLFLLLLLTCACVYYKKERKKSFLRDFERGKHQGYGSRQQRQRYGNEIRSWSNEPANTLNRPSPLVMSPETSRRIGVQSDLYAEVERIRNRSSIQPNHRIDGVEETVNRTSVEQVHSNFHPTRATNGAQIQPNLHFVRHNATQQPSYNYGTVSISNTVEPIHRNFEPTRSNIEVRIQPTPNVQPLRRPFSDQSNFETSTALLRKLTPIDQSSPKHKTLKQIGLVPARKPKCKIKPVLRVKNILNRKFHIPKETKKRHLYHGKEQLDYGKAIEITKNRGSQFTVNKSKRNHVFVEPKEFWLCEVEDPKNPEVSISNQPVDSFLCIYDEADGEWSSEYLGKFHAIFSMRGKHFPGILYRNVTFPSSTTNSDSS